MSEKPARISYWVLLLLSLPVTCLGQTFYWTGNGDGSSWSDSANWDNGLPNPSGGFIIGLNGAVVNLDIDATVAIHSAVGQDAGITSTLNMHQGRTLTVGDTLWIGNYGIGILNMSSGEIHISGGGFNNFILGQTGHGTVNMTGGTITLTGTVYVWAGNSQFNFNGGLVEANYLMIQEGSNLDITKGILKLNGDRTSLVDSYIADGRLTGYGGNSWIINVYDSGQNKTIVTANPAIAREPYPNHLATNVAPNVELSWTPGDYVPDTNGHRIYFSDTEQDVIDGALAAYQGIQTETTFDTTPLNLALLTEYYWRVDEANLSTSWDEGAVWKFTVADHLVLDNFDQYTDTNDLLLSWDDGDENGSKAQISLEKNIAQDGNSLKYVYDTNGWPFRAKAELVFDPAKDWAETGMEVLKLWFRGEADNDAEQMRVIIEDACNNIAMVKYNGDINDVKNQWWQEWNIAIEDFNSAGIDLKNVTKFTIEFFSVPLKFARGTVYFDNIWLQIGPYHCVPILGDTNHDCNVNFDDVNMLADSWLAYSEDYTLEEQQDIPTCAGTRDYHCYQEIDPFYADYNVMSRIRIEDVNDAETIYNEIIHYFWTEEGWPGDKMPVNIQYGINPPDWVTSSNVKRVDRLDIEMDYQMHSYVYHLIPENSVHRLVILHQGHSHTFPGGGVGNTANFLVDKGFSVMGYMMPLMGEENSKTAHGVPGYGDVTMSNHDEMSVYLENSRGSFLRFFVEPIVVGINYGQNVYDYLDFNMIGLSGGGCTTHICAAVERRIRYSFPTAGEFPQYLKNEGPCAMGEGDAEQYWPPLIEDRASWLDLFILGSYGPGRQEVQVLNQFDSCCFWGINYQTYVPYVTDAVENLGKGLFRVYLDKSHCTHQISDIVINEVIYPILSNQPVVLDLNQDGKVDFIDYAIMAKVWLNGN